MKLRYLSILAVAIATIGAYSCIDQENTVDAIFARDMEAIDEYLATNSLVNVKEFEDARGFRVIWQEVSGSGVFAEVGDTIRANYTGKLLDNSVFDTSIEDIARENGIYVDSRPYIPIQFRTGLGSVIPGFELGLLNIEVGDKATVIMPSELGYANNPPSGIPVNAPLIFEIELIEVKRGPTGN
ncbi:FKBP-type peptidyl-prolyl cis-trans isomerase [Algoriphagus sediminis]|uniref:Peptidyl-prolyl cis-trans isomerase n=1 Tax=Algoriphagus sediminis TaxID=3057113 RepID=A0ABT7YBW1_9BACT|nr:FKBP-type peptidyl-prolyl cis-trans isomerase [Algoriphagus sediminis]MDN3204020.1 FKBP-type peptidyl-prolyl cis-trans isomerase [Algoriphagus sediminis]